MRTHRSTILNTGWLERGPEGPLYRLSGEENTLSFAQRWRDIRTGFERPFWVANISELFERLSYYAAFASLARYLHEALRFPTERVGALAGFFGGLVWFLAIFGGTLADRMGFRRALSVAYLILSCAYFLLGSIAAPWLAPVRDAVPLVLLVTVVLALPAFGIALVKPSVVGTTARASNEKRPFHRLLHLLHPSEHWRRCRSDCGFLRPQPLQRRERFSGRRTQRFPDVHRRVAVLSRAAPER